MLYKPQPHHPQKKTAPLDPSPQWPAGAGWPVQCPCASPHGAEDGSCPTRAGVDWGQLRAWSRGPHTGQSVSMLDPSTGPIPRCTGRFPLGQRSTGRSLLYTFTLLLILYPRRASVHLPSQPSPPSQSNHLPSPTHSGSHDRTCVGACSSQRPRYPKEAPTAGSDADESRADRSAQCPPVDPSVASHGSQTSTGDSLLSVLLTQGGRTVATQETEHLQAILPPATICISISHGQLR